MPCMPNPSAAPNAGPVAGKRSKSGSIAGRLYLQIIASVSIKSFTIVNVALFGGAGARIGRRWS